LTQIDDPRFPLPPAFLEANRVAPDWLKALPDLIARLAARWSLTLDPPFPATRINYVAPATRVDGARCVFKVSRHLEDTRSEIAALRLWEGQGAARLLDADPEAGALLLERIEPGTMLVDTFDPDDDAATLVTADLLRQVWRPAPAASDLDSLDDWCGAYERNREALAGGEGGFPAALFRRADALRRELLASTEKPMVLHGDMHHYNVLQARRAPWLAIDPKGLAGDRHFDVCQFFRNPIGVRVLPATNRRRLGIFCAELGLDRERTRDWCFVHAMLDACWDFEDGNSWESAVAYALETQTF
jgi:streptomycin 6-kinase